MARGLLYIEVQDKEPIALHGKVFDSSAIGQLADFLAAEVSEEPGSVELVADDEGVAVVIEVVSRNDLSRSFPGKRAFLDHVFGSNVIVERVNIAAYGPHRSLYLNIPHGNDRVYPKIIGKEDWVRAARHRLKALLSSLDDQPRLGMALGRFPGLVLFGLPSFIVAVLLTYALVKGLNAAVFGRLEIEPPPWFANAYSALMGALTAIGLMSLWRWARLNYPAVDVSLGNQAYRRKRRGLRGGSVAVAVAILALVATILGLFV